MYTYNQQQNIPQLQTIHTNNKLYIDTTNIDYTNTNININENINENINLNLISCIFFIILFLWILFLILYINEKS